MKSVLVLHVWCVFAVFFYCGVGYSVAELSGLIGRCDEVGSPVNVTEEDLLMYGNCTTVPPDSVCDGLLHQDGETILNVYFTHLITYFDLSSTSDDVAIFLSLIEEPCRTIIERLICLFYNPPCGNRTHFIPPQSICMEDCLVVVEMCSSGLELLTDFILLQELEFNFNISEAGLFDCSTTDVVVSPLPHCCTKVPLEVVDVNSSGSGDVGVLAASIGAGVGILAVTIMAAAILVLVVRKRVSQHQLAREEAVSQDGLTLRNHYGVWKGGQSLSRDARYLGTNTVVQDTGSGRSSVYSKSTEQLTGNKVFIPSACIKLLDLIGKGEFGVVYRARLTARWSKDVLDSIVAVKTLRGSAFTPGDIDDMMKEAIRMKSFSHLNVLGLIGVCVDAGEAPYLVMPFMANGSLLSYLKKERANLTISHGANEEVVLDAQKSLLSMCLQIARGMSYLALNSIVHRDLAARNCMIDANHVIKVADFGLSESVYTRNYYRHNIEDEGAKLPMKWMAIESLHDGVFNEKTDVWSFGVTCWEVFSLARSPYPGVDPFTLIKHLDEGQRLEKPSNTACSSDIFDTIQLCWQEDPSRRPSFDELVVLLVVLLEGIVGYMDLSIVAHTNTL